MQLKPFDIQGDRIEFSPQFLAVPEFGVIWKRDKTKTKNKAIKELSYIVFLCDNTIANPYKGYPEDTRRDILIDDFIREKDWKEDDEIKAAIDKFKNLSETTSSRLVAAAMVAASKLTDYYLNVDLNAKDDNGKFLHSAKELQNNIERLGNTIKSLYNLNEQIKKEQLEGNITRGGFEIGDFEIPSDDIDYGESA